MSHATVTYSFNDQTSPSSDIVTTIDEMTDVSKTSTTGVSKTYPVQQLATPKVFIFYTLLN